MLLKTERLTIRRIAEEDWKSLLVIWKDFSSSDFAQYDSEDLSVWYEDYEIAFEVKEGEKAVLYRNENGEIDVDGFINVTYGTVTNLIEQPFYQDKFETSVPGKYAVIGYNTEGETVVLSKEELDLQIIRYDE